MRADDILRREVIAELEWEPHLNAALIGVAVKDGIVTLNGRVNSYYEKITAEKATKRVKGVRAVVEEIEVYIEGDFERTDEDIAQAALRNINWKTTIPEDNIVLKVEKGWITLEGEVEWNYQKQAVQKAVQYLTGVKGVTNKIKITSDVKPEKLHENIKRSFERSALIDAENVNIEIEDHKVTLTGTVRSWSEKMQAEATVWSAPGVFEVENNLEIKQSQPAL